VTSLLSVDSDHAQISLCVAVLLLSAKPLGAYIFKIMWRYATPIEAPFFLHLFYTPRVEKNGFFTRSKLSWST
jgi:hypothetical protein